MITLCEPCERRERSERTEPREHMSLVNAVSDSEDLAIHTVLFVHTVHGDKSHTRAWKEK